MLEINGIVKAVSQKDGRYGVCINDTWMNSFGTCPVAKGDNVFIKYEVNGNFKDIKQIGLRAIEQGTEVISPQKFTRPEEKVYDNSGTPLKIPETRKSVKGSAYEKDPVGLAVELFNEIFDAQKPNMLYDEIMDKACTLVKQAQEAFK